MNSLAGLFQAGYGMILGLGATQVVDAIATLTFAAFAVVLMVATEPRFGILAIAAWLVVEALLWSGVAGFGRGPTSNHR